jgi:hypothetical protein
MKSQNSGIGKISFEKLGIADINNFKETDPTHKHHDSVGHEVGVPMLTADEQKA